MTTDVAQWEADWAHATMLGEAVWYLVCSKSGWDSKDAQTRVLHGDVIALVRAAAFVLERDGFEGLAEWLELETRGLTVTPEHVRVDKTSKGDNRS